MVLLNKKKILTIITLLTISLISVGISKEDVVEKSNTIETVALPVSNRVVVLDAGHGKPDAGAQSARGILESDINLKIVLKLQKLLEQSGAKVILTRSNENSIYTIEKGSIREKKISDSKNRVKIGNSDFADIFVSIHLNKIDEEKYWGWQSFFQSKNIESKRLATNIQNNLNDSINKKNKRVPLKLDNVYIMKHIKIPTVIIECGFLSNNREEKLLTKDDYQEKLSWGIYNGIMDYFIENSKSMDA